MRHVFLLVVLVAQVALHGYLAAAEPLHQNRLRRHLDADEVVTKDEDAATAPAAPAKAEEDVGEQKSEKPKPSARPSMASKAPSAGTVTALSTFIRDMLHFKASKSEEMDFAEHERELQKLRGEYLVIACVGDSLTEGAQNDKRVLSYPAILQEKLTMPPYKVFNFGKGSTTAQVISRSGSAMPYTQTVQFKQSMAAHVDVVVIMLGTNDARKVFWNETRFKSDYTDLIERYQALPSKPIVFVCTPPPVYCTQKNCWFDVQVDVVNEVLPRLVPEIAYYTGASLIDNFAVFGGVKFSNPSSYYEPGHHKRIDWEAQNHPPYDGVHLNAEGHKRFADSVSWRVVESLHKANKTYNMYMHHVVPRDPKKIETLLMRDAAQRKKINHEDVYDHIASTSINASSDAAAALIDPETHWGGYFFQSGKDFIRPVIACVGDSITEGMGSSDDYLMSYPAVLQRHPGFHHFQVLNLGVAGTCVSKEKGGVRSYWATKQYDLAMRSHPHIVVLQFGSNDALEEIWDEQKFITDYAALITQFQSLPSKPSVYVAVPPPFYGAGKEEGFKKNVNVALPKAIRALVDKLDGVRLVDNHAALGGRALARPHTFNSDGLHPNDIGYFAIAHQVASVISTYEPFSPIAHKPPSAMRTPKDRETDAKAEVKEPSLAAQAAKSYSTAKAAAEGKGKEEAGTKKPAAPTASPKRVRKARM